MKLVTFKTSDSLMHAGVIRDNQVVALPYPTLLELLRDPGAMADMAANARRTDTAADPIYRDRTYMGNELPESYPSPDLSGEDVGTRFIASVLAPIAEPPTLRDFYAFEQHVKTGRAKRGLDASRMV